MSNKYHILPSIVCFIFAYFIAVINCTLGSFFDLLLIKNHKMAIIIYTILFMAVYYTGFWWVTLKKTKSNNYKV